MSEQILVTTEEFWMLMCKPGFVRESAHMGRCDAMKYTVLCAPEDVDGFIQDKIAETINALTFRPTIYQRLIGLFK